eukprot:scaffold76255_cov75-Phaeocystis_antarctica.AAC.3
MGGRGCTAVVLVLDQGSAGQCRRLEERTVDEEEVDAPPEVRVAPVGVLRPRCCAAAVRAEGSERVDHSGRATAAAAAATGAAAA